MAARMLCLNEAVGGGPLVGPTSMTTKYREDCHLFGIIQSLTRTPNIQIKFIEKLSLNLHIDMYVCIQRLMIRWISINTVSLDISIHILKIENRQSRISNVFSGLECY